MNAYMETTKKHKYNESAWVFFFSKRDRSQNGALRQSVNRGAGVMDLFRVLKISPIISIFYSSFFFLASPIYLPSGITELTLNLTIIRGIQLWHLEY